MAIFIFIHGTSHGGWCWERVAPLIEAKGHVARTPDLPCMGADSTPFDMVTPEMWDRFVIDLVCRESEPVVLVGHSRGGMQISAAAEAVPERIRRLVYLSGFVPKDGQSNLDLVKQFCAPGLLAAPTLPMKPNETGFAPEVARAWFYSATSDEWAERAVARLQLEPKTMMFAPARLTAGKFGTVSKAYIECERDQVIPVASQRAMQAHANFDAVFSLPADHSPFYSAPELLADALIRAAEPIAGRASLASTCREA
jgi:pimeloyl-ACP methyl ester carboxylesterase